MNNYQIKEYSLQFEGHSITINPSVMKTLGIIRAKSLIRVNDYQLACVPYSISLKDCRLLLILSPREQQIITESKNQNVMLHMEFHHPNLGKVIPLFFRLAIKSFKQLNSRLNQCLLDAVFMTVPQDYREIILEYFLKNEENRIVYSDSVLNNKKINAMALKPLKLGKQGVIRFGSSVKISCRIIEISLKEIRLFIDTEESVLNTAGQKIILELFLEGDPFFVNVSMKDFKASAEVEGYFLVNLELEYSSILTSTLSKLLTNSSPLHSATSEVAVPEKQKNKEKNEASSAPGKNSKTEDVLEEAALI